MSSQACSGGALELQNIVMKFRLSCVAERLVKEREKKCPTLGNMQQSGHRCWLKQTCNLLAKNCLQKNICKVKKRVKNSSDKTIREKVVVSRSECEHEKIENLLSKKIPSEDKKTHRGYDRQAERQC